MEVRQVEPEEHERVGELVVSAYRQLPGLHLHDEYIGQLRDVGGRAAGAVVLVAVDGDDLVGAVTYVPGPASPYAERLREGEAGIRMLAVDPRAQRRGGGQLLVEACIERARREGRQAVVLHTTAWMTVAQRLYARLGFRRDPWRDWSPLPHIPLLGFVLGLRR